MMQDPFENPIARLFTYKVKYDGGTAPNPDSGICTLALCKPAIRRSANKGDVVVGFGCKSNGDNEHRVVYCMIIDEALSWPEYIKAVARGDYKNRLPKRSSDTGDCIWKDTKEAHDPWPSHSQHDRSDYQSDVVDGRNVLIGKEFWYFGKGGSDKERGSLDIIIKSLPIVNRGHRSTSNFVKRKDFWEEFAEQLEKRWLTEPGKYGEPATPPSHSDDGNCRRCCSAQRTDDKYGEEP